jgi:hypothetical protein
MIFSKDGLDLMATTSKAYRATLARALAIVASVVPPVPEDSELGAVRDACLLSLASEYYENNGKDGRLMRVIANMPTDPYAFFYTLFIRMQSFTSNAPQVPVLDRRQIRLVTGLRVRVNPQIPPWNLSAKAAATPSS